MKDTRNASSGGTQIGLAWYLNITLPSLSYKQVGFILAERTIGLGAVLVILGVGTFGLLGFDTSNWTPLIPAFFGVPLLILGLLAQRQRKRSTLLISLAMLLAALAFAGTVSSLAQVPALLSGGTVPRPMAVLEQAITALLTGTYLVVSLRAMVMRRHQRNVAR